MNLNTTFERHEDRIVAQRPDANKPETILQVATLEEGFAIPAANAEAAIRRAYALGRADERRQTQAVLRGLIGQ